MYTENDTGMSTVVKVKFDYEFLFCVLKYFLPNRTRTINCTNASMNDAIMKIERELFSIATIILQKILQTLHNCLFICLRVEETTKFLIWNLKLSELIKSKRFYILCIWCIRASSTKLFLSFFVFFFSKVKQLSQVPLLFLLK